MPIRWRLTLFIALAIGAILLVLGVALFFLLREALHSNVEETARKRAVQAAATIEDDDSLEKEDVSEYTLDGVIVIVRDGKGDVLYPDMTNLPARGAAKARRTSTSCSLNPPGRSVQNELVTPSCMVMPLGRSCQSAGSADVPKGSKNAT